VTDADQLQIELSGFPTAIRPMQAVSAEAPFSADEYLFEVKWDGLRCLLFVDPEGWLRLHDRAMTEVTDSFPELAGAVDQVPAGTVLDGELVAVDAEGRPDYPLLRRRLTLGPAATGDIQIAFLAFDVLYVGGKPLARQPLSRRKTQLRRAVTSGHHLFVPDYIDAEGVELFEACLERGLEGVMAKHRESTYVPGQRSPFWLKVKAVKGDDFVVIGWTPGDPFGALLVGYYERGSLLPCGSVSGGYELGVADALVSTLKGLETAECPLQPAPVVTAPAHWCRPELVISVRYSEWAPDGTLRFPIFNGLRPEVHPAECVRHRPRVVIGGRARPGTPAFDLTRFAF
jgi:DNA ligase D-like protein (predicted ligase)